MLAKAEAVPIDPIERLIRQCRYREAVALCAERHGTSLGRLCMALLGSQADAEEAVQETLLAACAGMSDYRGDGSVRAWLFAIARRQCARRVERGARERQRRDPAIDPQDAAASAGDSPAMSIVAMRRARAVRSALAELRPTERDALLLHYQAELSFREIAEVCGIDEAAARKRASRGLARLRKALSSESVEG
jgi:RNA polymerase sigma-70 factor (ECF subfamily)